MSLLLSRVGTTFPISVALGSTETIGLQRIGQLLNGLTSTEAINFARLGSITLGLSTVLTVAVSLFFIPGASAFFRRAVDGFGIFRVFGHKKGQIE